MILGRCIIYFRKIWCQGLPDITREDRVVFANRELWLDRRKICGEISGAFKSEID